MSAIDSHVRAVPRFAVVWFGNIYFCCMLRGSNPGGECVAPPRPVCCKWRVHCTAGLPRVPTALRRVLPLSIPAMARSRMEEVYKVTVHCPLAHTGKPNKLCKNGITVYRDRTGAWTDESQVNVAERIANHLNALHDVEPWGVAHEMGIAACEKAQFWTDLEDTSWMTPPRHDPRPVTLTSAAAPPIGASSSSLSGSGSGGTASSRTAADLSPATLAVIENMPVHSLWALIEAAQREISQRTRQ